MMIDVFLFSFNAVLPLILLVVIGYVIMRLRIVDDVFISKANRFCFTVAFPFNLFNSIVKRSEERRGG